MMRRWIAAAALAGLSVGVPLFALQEKPKEEPKKEARTAYVRRLFEKDRCSYADACRIVLSLVKGEHSDAAFADLRKDLVERGLVEEGWGLEEGSPVTKGTLAYMIAKGLSLPGGVTVKIFGWSRRYAFRECLYQGLMSGTTDMEYVTGREMLDVLSDAETYKAAGNLDAERK